jgi:hypothetical protein
VQQIGFITSEPIPLSQRMGRRLARTYYRARYYDQNSGRFLGEDPQGERESTREDHQRGWKDASSEIDLGSGHRSQETPG